LALITDLITKKQRNTIDHSRVACFCDTSSTNALAQCQAYYAAYPDLNPDLIFQYDLSTAGAKTRETAWELWGKDWYDLIVSNNIEGICCNPEFDTDSPLWPGYSALNVLGDILSLRRSMLVVAPINPDVFNPASPRVTPTPYSNSQYPYQFVSWYSFGGIRKDGPVPPPNPFVPESIISAEGDNAYDYTIPGVVPENKEWDYSSGMLSGEWDLSRDYLGQKIIYIPTWRIGWKSISQNPSEITTSEITAMVERSIATAGSIKSHIDKPIVTSSRQRVSDQYFIGQAMFTDTIFKDLGFTNVKWGYSKDQGGVSILNSYNTKLNTNNYDPDETSNTNVQFTLDNIAGTVGNQYRDLGPNYLVEDNYKWHAHNTNTFPMPVFTYVGGCLVNINVNTNGSWCDGGADAVFDIQDGAVLFEMTSHFLQYAGWAIKNGASAVHGSYAEPLAYQVDSGGNFASNLLKGNQVATSAIFGMSSSPRNIEVWGDGLAAPYYNESEEENNMNNVKFELVAGKASVQYFTSSLPPVTTAGTGHQVGDVIIFNGSEAGSGIKIQVATIDGSGGVATYLWICGGLGFANSEVLTQSRTTGSGINAVLTLSNNITTQFSPVGFGFFSDPLTSAVSVAAGGNNSTLYNSAGVEFAFSQFNPDIPDVHALISNPASNGFGRPQSIGLWVEGDIASWPYGDNVVFYFNGVAYPFLESYITEGSAVWANSAVTLIPGFSRLEWLTDVSKAHPAPIIIEGDKIGMSLTVPERQSSKSVISRSVISHNTES